MKHFGLFEVQFDYSYSYASLRAHMSLYLLPINESTELCSWCFIILLVCLSGVMHVNQLPFNKEI